MISFLKLFLFILITKNLVLLNELSLVDDANHQHHHHELSGRL